MVSVVTGIITAPRKVGYLDRSLETYQRQELPTPHVFAEPGAEFFYYKSQVVLHKNRERLGCFDNWRAAARWLLLNTESDYILMCEDDTSWNVGAWPIMADFAQPDRVISGWTSLVNATFGITGWQKAANLSYSGWCGSLALLYPRGILNKVVLNHNLTKEGGVHLDTDMGFALQELNVPIYCHHPSLVHHLGNKHSTFPHLTDDLQSVDARQCYATCRDRR
jgi:hypothetical protein